MRAGRHGCVVGNLDTRRHAIAEDGRRLLISEVIFMQACGLRRQAQVRLMARILD